MAPKNNPDRVLRVRLPRVPMLTVRSLVKVSRAAASAPGRRRPLPAVGWRARSRPARARARASLRRPKPAKRCARRSCAAARPRTQTAAATPQRAPPPTRPTAASPAYPRWAGVCPTSPQQLSVATAARQTHPPPRRVPHTGPRPAGTNPPPTPTTSAAAASTRRAPLAEPRPAGRLEAAPARGGARRPVGQLLPASWARGALARPRHARGKASGRARRPRGAIAPGPPKPGHHAFEAVRAPPGPWGGGRPPRRLRAARCATATARPDTADRARARTDT